MQRNIIVMKSWGIITCADAIKKISAPHTDEAKKLSEETSDVWTNQFGISYYREVERVSTSCFTES